MTHLGRGCGARYRGAMRPAGRLAVVLGLALAGVAYLALAGSPPGEAAPEPRHPEPRAALELGAAVLGATDPAPARALPPPADPTDGASARHAVEPAAKPSGLGVRVVDADGKPRGGVRVELTMSLGRPSGKNSGNQLGTATTRAEDGVATIPLTEVARMQRDPAAAAQLALLKVNFSVGADVAAVPVPRVALAGWPRDGDELELRLPPTGCVKVRVLAQGAPVQGLANVGWWWLPADVAAANPTSGYERVTNHLVEAPDGVVVIEGVGLGLTLQVQASAPGLTHTLLRDVPGPRLPGEVCAVDVQLGPPLARLRLRVLDLDGRPVTDQRLSGELWSDPDHVPDPASRPPRPDDLELRTDAHGIATFTRVPGNTSAHPRLDVRRHTQRADSSPANEHGIGSLVLPRNLAAGATVDLGDVQLAPMPIAAQGVVVDTAGAPLADVTLWFQERLTPQHAWTNLRDGSLRSDRLGTFLLRTPRLPKELSVTAAARGLQRRDFPVAPGTRDLRLVLEREVKPAVPTTGAIRVQVALDPEVNFMAILLVLRRADGAGRSPDWGPAQAWNVEGLAPGNYDVWLETRAGGLELARVRGIPVVAGQVSEDARLAPFDARGLVRTVELEAVKPDRAPWRRTSLTVVAHDGVAGREFQVKTDDEGRATLVLPTRITTLTVALDERRRATVTVGAAAGPVRVELSDA